MLVVFFLRRGENQSTRRKTSRSKEENQQQTQPTYDAGSRNRTRDTMVGGERSHHCANPAPCSPPAPGCSRFFTVQNLYDLRMSSNSFLYWITQKIISTWDRPRWLFCPFTLPLPDFGQKSSSFAPPPTNPFYNLFACILLNARAPFRQLLLNYDERFCLCRHNGRQALYEKETELCIFKPFRVKNNSNRSSSKNQLFLRTVRNIPIN